MNILVVGEPVNFEECKAKFGESHVYTHQQSHENIELDAFEVIFDFILDEDPFQMEGYFDNPKVPVFVNTTKISLIELSNLLNHKLSSTVFGFNGMPTFLNRQVLEVSVLESEDQEALKNICQRLATDYLLVEDRVGLVTPRIICMIINEAYYMVQEGNATRDDIDRAMKLGTNYPYGPFEWCTRIGINHVYELLEAVYNDTHDERYKICPLLKREYLQD